MKYFYSAAVMGYGDGRWWHKFYDFPHFPRVTKTLTANPICGNPLAVIKLGSSVYNRIGLHNIGFYDWLTNYVGCKYDTSDKPNITVSIAGSDAQIRTMIWYMERYDGIYDIELNFSCPNVRSFNNAHIPNTSHNIYLKLNYKMDPYQYDLDKVKGIRLNSVPLKVCGGSGKVAKDKNWGFIRQFGKELNVAGCSFNSMDDINKLEDMGCTEIGIGSTILTNPKLIESL